jgi:hypothetical protein
VTEEFPATEGKASMSVEAYRLIVAEALKITYRINQLLFAPLYCILCWNLGARSISVGCLACSHLAWEDKIDQEGENVYPRYVVPIIPTQKFARLCTLV